MSTPATPSYALLEILAPSGHQAPPHIHDDDDEGVFVLEGELTIELEDGTTVLRPGQGANIPAGTPHSLRVTSAGPVRALIVAAPGRFADFVRMAGRPAERDALPVVDGPPDFELLARAAAGDRHDAARRADARPPTSPGGPRTMRATIITCALAALTLIPATASAGTISYQGDTLVLQAAPGEANSVTFGGEEAGRLSISDSETHTFPADRCTPARRGLRDPVRPPGEDPRRPRRRQRPRRGRPHGPGQPARRDPRRRGSRRAQGDRRQHAADARRRRGQRHPALRRRR